MEGEKGEEGVQRLGVRGGEENIGGVYREEESRLVGQVLVLEQFP